MKWLSVCVLIILASATILLIVNKMRTCEPAQYNEPGNKTVTVCMSDRRFGCTMAQQIEISDTGTMCVIATRGTDMLAIDCRWATEVEEKE